MPFFLFLALIGWGITTIAYVTYLLLSPATKRQKRLPNVLLSVGFFGLLMAFIGLLLTLVIGKLP